MMLMVGVAVAIALHYAERQSAADHALGLRREFAAELDAARQVRELRRGALEERARQLARKPRLHAALEDGALDLLYPTALDELRDITEPITHPSAPAVGSALHARFYRFLDRRGALIPPANATDVGLLDPHAEAALALPGAPESVQLGYLVEASGAINELLAVPIFSSETGRPIAALVLGFARPDLLGRRAGEDTVRGLWLHTRLHLHPATTAAPEHPAYTAAAALAARSGREHAFAIGRVEHLVFHQPLNRGSLYPPAAEVCFFPLEKLAARQRRLRLEILGAGALLLVGTFFASRLLAARFAAPVERLAVASAENQLGRARAETALELTSEELERAARFASDASHQLKTPLTVLRAGLDELRTRPDASVEEQDQLSALVHQTYRLAHVVDDLLLLSRMEAGAVRLQLAPIDLSALIEAALDDLGALSDELELTIETEVPTGLLISGEKGYTALILQNLFENARKYNHPGGRIRVVARAEPDAVTLLVSNTGQGIPPAAQTRIFERFHRGAAGGSTPGHGLGLNLARELARLHGGGLRLVRSDPVWTEFELRLPSP